MAEVRSNSDDLKEEEDAGTGSPITSTTPDCIDDHPSMSKNQGNYEPYTVFSHRKKWLIILLVAVAGFLSPLSSNIYFPALPVLTGAFHKSQEMINLTVTVFMICQGFCKSSSD